MKTKIALTRRMFLVATFSTLVFTNHRPQFSGDAPQPQFSGDAPQRPQVGGARGAQSEEMCLLEEVPPSTR